MVQCLLIIALLRLSWGFLSTGKLKSIRTSIAMITTLGRDNNSNRLSPRVKRIKELTTQKNIVNDLTAAEFALTVEMKKSQDIKIDYEMLIARLEKNLRTLHTIQNANMDDINESNTALIDRVQRTKADVLEAFKNYKELQSNNSTSLMIPPIGKAVVINTVKLNESDTLDFDDIKEKLNVFVREDGTIDWDGAIASGKEVAKFGTELFERLNGKGEAEGMLSMAELFGQVQEPEPENDETRRLSGIVEEAKLELVRVQAEAETMRSNLREARRNGQGVTSADLQQLRLLDARAKDEEQKVRLFALDLDLERICLFLQMELEAAVEQPVDQRLFVAEVALIDKQLSTLFSSLRTKDNVDELVTLIDPDELTLISNQVLDLKNRLGIDSAATREVDWGTIGKLVAGGFTKTKEGLAFYGLGTKLLISDIQYAWGLLLKAAKSGYTLKPREVNAARRTGRDVLTLVPFTIILIIPLTPVGHVLVFNFIQRFFPDFFPSCYTEKRLNLLRLYSEIERKTEDDILGLPAADESPLQKAFETYKPLIVVMAIILLVFVIL